MANHTEPQAPTCSGTDEAQTFEYPTMVVGPNLAAQAPRTVHPENDSQSEDAQSTTSDSTFEIISHHDSDDDDEEGESQRGDTESLAAATDEASSVADTEEFSHVPASIQVPTPVTSSHDDADSNEQVLTPSMDNSEMGDSSIVARTMTQSMSDWIEFEESVRGEGDVVEAVHTLPAMPVTESGRKVTYTMRQSMTSQGLKLHRPFRVFYHGDSSIKDQIVEKIAQAIASSTDNDKRFMISGQKLNIVSIPSFEKQCPPQVTLIPSTGMEIEVFDHTSSKVAPLWQGGGLRVTNGLSSVQIPRPDLAIITHDSNKEAGLSDRSFTLRYSASLGVLGIPTLDIGSTPDRLCTAPQGPEFKPYKNQAVHMCKEAREAGGSRPGVVLERFPLDIATFMSLDPHQMNRNIACLTGPNIAESQGSISHPFTNIFASCNGFWTLVKSRSSLGRKALADYLRKDNPPSVLCVHRSGPFTWSMIFMFFVLSAFTTFIMVNNFLPNASFSTAKQRTDSVQPFLSSPVSVTTERITQWVTVTPTSTSTVPMAKPTSKEVRKVELGLSVVNQEVGLSKPMEKPNKPFKMMLPKGTQTKLLKSDDDRLFLRLSNVPPKEWRPSAEILKVYCEGEQRTVSYEPLTSDTFEVFIWPTKTCAKPLSLDLYQSNAQRVHKTVNFPALASWPSLDAIEKALATSRVPEHFIKAQAALMERLKQTEEALDQLGARMGSNIAEEIHRIGGQSATWSRRGLEEMQGLFAQARDTTDAWMNELRSQHFQEKIEQKKDFLAKKISTAMQSTRGRVAQRRGEVQHRLQAYYGMYRNRWDDMALPNRATNTLRKAHKRASVLVNRLKDRIDKRRVGRQERRAYGEINRAARRSADKGHGCRSRTWKSAGGWGRSRGCSGNR